MTLLTAESKDSSNRKIKIDFILVVCSYPETIRYMIPELDSQAGSHLVFLKNTNCNQFTSSLTRLSTILRINIILDVALTCHDITCIGFRSPLIPIVGVS